MNKKGSRGAEEGFQVMYTVLFYGDGPSILSYISTTGLKTEVGTQRNFNINFHFLVPGPDFMEITKLNCFKLNWQKNCFKGS